VIRGYCIVQVKTGSVTEVGKAIRALPKVTSVDTVTGPHDIIAVVEAENLRQVQEVLADQIPMIPGITRTIPCLRVS